MIEVTRPLALSITKPILQVPGGYAGFVGKGPVPEFTIARNEVT
jgi:hypothetical protein